MPVESGGILVDASAFAALANVDDQNHGLAREIWKRIQYERLAPFTTSFIVAETHALLVARAGRITARNWLGGQAVPEAWVTEADYARARDIIQRHRDKSYTLTDATSFGIMERLRVRLAFTFDTHFDQYGFHRLLP